MKGSVLLPQPALTGGNRQDYLDEIFGASMEMYSRAGKVIAGGTTHDGWLSDPCPVYIEKAKGAYKFDAQGRQIIDYWMGHGALIQGHSFPPVVGAVRAQAEKGTHFGAPSLLEVEWAEIVCSMIPSAERVRFTSSGTEATLLAFRTARAYTGRQLIIKFDGHFHGWHDESLAHFFPTKNAGLNEGGVTRVYIADPFSDTSLEELMDEDVAAIILEPGGGGSGGLPWSREMLQKVRDVATKFGSLLIFDEVVSGFRYGTGGVQGLCGILPDITVLGKILAGGLPGGAVAGSREVMDVFGQGKIIDGQAVRVPHTGTFNANPLSAAAGIALLNSIKDGAAQKKAEQSAENLVCGVNSLARRERVDICVYRQSSTFHTLIGAKRNGYDCAPSAAVLKLYSQNQRLYSELKKYLLAAGVDSHPIHGWLSAAHDEQVIGQTLEIFSRVFRELKAAPGFSY